MGKGEAAGDFSPSRRMLSPGMDPGDEQRSGTEGGGH